VYISNQGIDWLAAYWSPRSADRIRDGLVLEYAGESQRRTVHR
jgi:hypothetical protein